MDGWMDGEGWDYSWEAAFWARMAGMLSNDFWGVEEEIRRKEEGREDREVGQEVGSRFEIEKKYKNK